MQKVDVHLYERTRWFVYVSICVCCKSSTEEGGTKVDCDAREPDDYKEWESESGGESEEGKLKTICIFKEWWTKFERCWRYQRGEIDKAAYESKKAESDTKWGDFQQRGCVFVISLILLTLKTPLLIILSNITTLIIKIPTKSWISRKWHTVGCPWVRRPFPPHPPLHNSINIFLVSIDILIFWIFGWLLLPNHE